MLKLSTLPLVVKALFNYGMTSLWKATSIMEIKSPFTIDIMKKFGKLSLEDKRIEMIVILIKVPFVV